MALYYDEILAGNCFGQINVVPPSPNGALVTDKKRSANLSDEYGFSLEELFYIARQFLKEKQASKEIQLKYDDNIRLIALLKQVKIGKWDASYTPNVGFLDVVGSDRKQAWLALGDMSKEKAMEEYVETLLDRCSMFRSYLVTRHLENETNDQQREADDIRRTLEQQAERVRQYELQQVSRVEKKNKKREDFQRKHIQDVLNQQTYSQFKAYAEQQYRDNRQAQEELIRQLQEQHFQQYLQQIYQQQILDQNQQLQAKLSMDSQQQPENVLPSTFQLPLLTSVDPANILPPLSTNIIIPPASLNIISTPVPTNIVVPASPTNAVPLVSSVPLQTLPSMPPLGPAPAQLPPLVHPPTIPPQSIVNNNAMESAVPFPSQFETLSLNTPLEAISSASSHTLTSIVPPQQFQLTQINSDGSAKQELADGNHMPALGMEASAIVNPNGESILPPEDGKREPVNIIPANMWTRKDIKEFKEQIRKEKDAVIKIGSGETVTVRVPTHEDGQCVFWEFATDYYDLGFGVYFEWSKAPSNTVTVHVSDSSDEEEEGNEDGSNPEKKDIEKGSGSTNKPPKPPQDEVVPIYRRDCHEEVYAGSHPYPGHGVYLLKFDNSFSLWRSKTLYYRVYYSK